MYLDFPVISVEYLPSSRSGTAPYFIEDLPTVDSIPCVADADAATWSYAFPQAYDNESDTISYTFTSEISDLVTFDESS